MTIPDRLLLCFNPRRPCAIAVVTAILHSVVCAALSGCGDVDPPRTPSAAEPARAHREPEATPSLVVMAAPPVTGDEYADDFEKIIDLQVRLARVIGSGDSVVILADRATLPHLRQHLPETILLEAEIDDIWLRDFGAVEGESAVRFVYRPRYLEPAIAAGIQGGFDRFARVHGLRFRESRLVLDGGNVVSNGAGMAVLTRRILDDNPARSRGEVVATLEEELGLRHVALVPEEPGDRTGHADGMATWASETVLVVRRFEEPFRGRFLDALREGLPGVAIEEVESALSDETWRGFPSAHGLNVNAIVTSGSIYVPVFGTPWDDAFLATLRRHSGKRILPIDARAISRLGGSLRCLSWHLTGENARRLIEAAAGPR